MKHEAKGTKKMAMGGMPMDGGEIPQEAQNTLMDRKEEKTSVKRLKTRSEENEAPKKFVKEKFKALKDMLGIKNKSTVEKAVGMHDKQLHGGKKTNLKKLKKGGSIDGCAVRGKTKGTMIAMKKGGMSC